MPTKSNQIVAKIYAEVLFDWAKSSNNLVEVSLYMQRLGLAFTEFPTLSSRFLALGCGPLLGWQEWFFPYTTFTPIKNELIVPVTSLKLKNFFVDRYLSNRRSGSVDFFPFLQLLIASNRIELIPKIAVEYMKLEKVIKTVSMLSLNSLTHRQVLVVSQKLFKSLSKQQIGQRRIESQRDRYINLNFFRKDEYARKGKKIVFTDLSRTSLIGGFKIIIEDFQYAPKTVRDELKSLFLCLNFYTPNLIALFGDELLSE